MIRAAVVGYGYAGKHFHCYLVGLAEGIELRAISTRALERQRAAASDYPGVKVYGSLESVLADDETDLVILATPHDTHRDLAIQAMSAGKHVVTDKVMCMGAGEAEEMIAASQEHGVMLSVFHNRRWDWDYLTVKKAIDDGLLGTPYLFQVGIMGYRAPRNWRGIKARSGGILYDWPAHFMDQALQLVPADVEGVFCDIKYRDTWDTDIGNYAKLLIRFSNDVLYQVEIGNLAAIPIPRWYVLGDRGGLIKYGLDPQEGPMREGRIEDAEEAPADRARVVTVACGEREERILDSVRGSWTCYYQNISDVLNRGAELAVKPQEALKAMRVYDAAMLSAETGRVVKL
jgi:scyllo-inositol 2-dehydrogenase (NADP+)